MLKQSFFNLKIKELNWDVKENATQYQIFIGLMLAKQNLKA